ncbi:MAG: EF-P lysine aminoacylase EpmA [Planctomycetota bacterium]
MTPLESLRLRSDTLRAARGFFNARGFLEVETPLLADEAIPETHIDPFEVPGGGWLQASPELHMKRLLAAGSGSIYQITRSFRAGEVGPQHRPEFTIVEWYGVGDDMQAGMRLLSDFCQTAAGAPPATHVTYGEAFQQHAGIDPFESPTTDLIAAADLDDTQDRDLLLDALSSKVHEKLGQAAPEILYHYPAAQSALATTTTDENGHAVAERFELFWRGIELANGYHELTDPAELRRRFESVHAARRSSGKTTSPMPESLLGAMESGLPACAGVALGFDRLLMAMTGAEHL